MAKNRKKANRLANQGNTNVKQIAKQTGVSRSAARNIVNRAQARQSAASASPAASMYINSAGTPVQTQAPDRPSHVNESYVDAGSGQSYNTRFVPGAMLPGQKGYDAATGGGVWAAGPVSDEAVRAWYRSADPWNTAGDKAIEMSGKDASAFTLGGLYGDGSSSVSEQAASDQSEKKKGGYKGIKSIRQGLKIGMNNIISDKEARKIARRTGKNYDDVLAKGLSLGFDVSAKAANKSNRRYSKTMSGQMLSMGANPYGIGDYMRGKDPLAAMRGKNLAKGFVYSGTGTKDGSGPAIIGRKNKGSNPLGIRQQNVGLDPINESADQVTSETMNVDSSGAGGFTLPDQADQADQANLSETLPTAGMMSGGGLGALSASKLLRARSRLQRLGILNRGTGLLGRGLQYGNALNA
jgi:hypothetical protein